MKNSQLVATTLVYRLSPVDVQGARSCGCILLSLLAVSRHAAQRIFVFDLFVCLL